MTGAARKIRILCVDDHPLIREGIASAFQEHDDLELVAEATNGVEAIRSFRECQPDIVLMDLRMPEMDGIHATIEILKEFPKARIIILTTYAGDVSASRALKSGARGYLLKQMLRTDLIDTIRTVHSGRTCVPAEIAQEIAVHINAEELSTRELDVLRSMAKGQSNKAIGIGLGISAETVKGHVRNILEKLQANDRTHAVAVAMERGYFDSDSME
ncbi:response regulator transcription factor [Terriglobus sp. ADX1]|uniref:response regulator transcription factor n=1 Tax=Terriglobus sp. ADX1 TaxID=2794063 RepID=UPI002FE524F0